MYLTYLNNSITAAKFNLYCTPKKHMMNHKIVNIFMKNTLLYSYINSVEIKSEWINEWRVSLYLHPFLCCIFIKYVAEYVFPRKNSTCYNHFSIILYIYFSRVCGIVLFCCFIAECYMKIVQFSTHPLWEYYVVLNFSIQMIIFWWMKCFIVYIFD